MSSVVATEKSPWGWGTLLIVSFFAGFVAGGIIAGINWRRMGKHSLVWPTIILSIAIFILFVWFMPATVSNSTANFISLVFAGVLWWSQKGYYREWKESHPEAKRAGWQIPLVTVIVILGLIIGLVFL